MTDERKNLPSASAMHRYAQCPGSWALSQGIDAEPPGPDAERGTRIHRALELKFSDITNWDDGLSENERSCAVLCVIILMDIAAQRGFTQCTSMVERRIWLLDGNLERVLSGKADLILRTENDERVLIVDWKTGRGEVDPAESNMQLRTLAVLAFEEFGPQHVIAAIIQPDAVPQFSMVEYDRNTIEIATNEITGIIERLKTHAHTRSAGPHCRYCPARVKCAEYAAMAAGQLPALPVQPLPPMEQWTPEQWAAVLNWLPEAERWIEEAKTKAKTRLEEDPQSIPGWALKPGPTRRAVTDVQQLFNRMAGLGITADQFAASCSITVKGVEGLVKIARPELKGAALTEAVDELLAGVAEESPTAPRLVKS